MLRSTDLVRSALTAAAAEFMGAKTSQMLNGSPASLGTLVAMNAIGNFSLALTLGTMVELTGISALLFSGFRSATSKNQSFGLKAANFLFGSTIFTAREVTGAAVGYGLFMLTGQNPGISLANFLVTTAVGSELFSLAVYSGAQGLTLFGSKAAQGALNLLAMNVHSMVTDATTAPALR